MSSWTHRQLCRRADTCPARHLPPPPPHTTIAPQMEHLCPTPTTLLPHPPLVGRIRPLGPPLAVCLSRHTDRVGHRETDTQPGWRGPKGLILPMSEVREGCGGAGCEIAVFQSGAFGTKSQFGGICAGAGREESSVQLGRCLSVQLCTYPAVRTTVHQEVQPLLCVFVLPHRTPKLPSVPSG